MIMMVYYIAKLTSSDASTVYGFFILY